MITIYIVARADDFSIDTQMFTEKFRAEERAKELRECGFLVSLDEYDVLAPY